MKPFFRLLLAGSILAFPMLAADFVVVQKDTQFSQAQIRVKVGDTISFRNDDNFTHSLFSISPGAEFGSYMQKPTEKVKVEMKKAGDFEVQCAIHPKMKLSVSVQK